MRLRRTLVILWWVIMLVMLLLLVIERAKAANNPTITSATCRVVTATWQDPPFTADMTESYGYVWLFRDEYSPVFARLQYMNGLYNTHIWYAILSDYPPDHYQVYGYIVVKVDGVEQYYYTDIVRHSCGVYVPILFP